MNQKFCGDSRDLFKYDLIFTIMKNLQSELASFTFVPMLTPDDLSALKRSAGQNNEKLVKLLAPFSGEGGIKLYLQEIKNLFESEGIKINILNDTRFTRKSRDAYFEKILDNLPENSLIFFDPDTGLTEKNATEKHMKYSELKKIYEKSDPGSILMIYQHYPRYGSSEKRRDFPKKKVGELEDYLHGKYIHRKPLFISDNEILFVFLTRNSELQEKLGEILDHYTEMYGNTFRR